MPLSTSIHPFLLGLLLLLPGVAPGETALPAPAITSIQLAGTNLVVVVSVPAGIRKVTLEGRSRLERGTWVPRAVRRLDGSGGDVTFQLPGTEAVAVLRVRASATERLPDHFYRGPNSFAGQSGTGQLPGTVRSDAGGLPVDMSGGPSANPTGVFPGAPPARSVVESDIWKIQGDTLYFFNQNRGLQVIDLTEPDAPRLRASLSLPAVGEQMYLLDATHVLLLARDGCDWSPGGAQSRALVVDVSGGTLPVVASVPIAGSVQESRLVGSALYVASQAYRPVAGTQNGSWEYGTVVSAYDFADVTAPVAKAAFWYAGYDNKLTATDRFLFVATQDPADYWRSVVRCLDISAPDGTMTLRAAVSTWGIVRDKFKMNLHGDVFTTITERWDGLLVTKLETFSLTPPAALEKLGELELARGEQLHASRFDGDRAYVVTFQRLDPLWVVDLSDPAHPAITGEVRVPGWSTYLQPWGDRLVTIGIDNTNGWRVAVSLFDVHDAAHPALLSQVPLGENYSWSEANYEDKAFGFLPEAGLLLVPFASYSTTSQQGVQLIDLGRDTLTMRGSIDRAVPARRATLHGARVLAVSARELVSVEAADRDHPQVRGRLELAWAADRVLVHGGHLLEFDSNGFTAEGPAVRVVATNDLDHALSRVNLGSLPLLGVTAKDDRLYVVQGQSRPLFWRLTPVGDGNPPQLVTNDARLVLSVFDLAQLPALPLLGQTKAAPGEQYFNRLDAVWPRPDLLVWASRSSGFWGWLDGGAPGAAGVTAQFAPGAVFPWYSGGGGSQLLAFDVHDSILPKFASRVDLSGTNGWWNSSPPQTADGLIYLSHSASEYHLTGTNVSVAEVTTFTTETNVTYVTNFTKLVGPDRPTEVVLVTNVFSFTDLVQVPHTTLVTNEWPAVTWEERSFLDVVDFADAVNPVVRPPVNIPGALRGVSHEGAVLYTVGNHWDPVTHTTDGREWLDATAYDGVEAHWIASLALPVAWPHPLVITGPNIFLGKPVDSANGIPTPTGALESWTLTDTGAFASLGTLAFPTPLQNLVARGPLLGAQFGSEVRLLDASAPATLRVVGSSSPTSCLWYNLDDADGSLDQGLWLPLGEYGAGHLGLDPAP